ncbi:hypothetical protein V1264_013615 [Littorina saxatilis]|uniref:Apple domain-containing protein n=1 Tax=Littorina saxatilis TaxID=31220 RepID=A0AAN9BNJ6_9CAEN
MLNCSEGRTAPPKSKMTLPSLPVWFVAILCATFILYCGADTVSVNGTNGTLFEMCNVTTCTGQGSNIKPMLQRKIKSARACALACEMSAESDGCQAFTYRSGDNDIYVNCLKDLLSSIILLLLWPF